MESVLMSKIPDVIQTLVDNFDHVEFIQKFRVVVNRKDGKTYMYKEYIVHCDPGKYDATIVFKTKEGKLEIYNNELTVYDRKTARYFIFKVPDEFEKELILVLLKRTS